ncbi:MAG: hypothetical protein ACSLEM_04050 [Candidatus Malihini olakiniferum]
MKSLRIANQLLEHFLWYFAQHEGAPKMFLEDECGVFALDYLLEEQMHESAFLEIITIRDHKFDLTYIKFHASVNKKTLDTSLAQWLSPFAVKVSQMSQGQVKFATLVHIQQYTRKWHKVPHDKFLMLNEIILSLVSLLERAGYVISENMVPDISNGRIFYKWLRTNRGIKPNDFNTNEHEYVDGCVVLVKFYQINFYWGFRKRFHEI